MPALRCERDSPTSFCPATWASRLRGHTPESRFIRFAPELLSALVSGTLVPPGINVSAPEDDTWYDGTPVEHVASERDDVPRGLDELCEQIASAIDALGGAVAPKLDTVAPTDATWVSFYQSLRCETPADVLTLIAASERVMRVADTVVSPVLALRTWISNFDGMMEYRVFVRDGGIVGISQRNTSVPSSLTRADMDRVFRAIDRQFHSLVRATFAAILIVDICDDRGGTANEEESYAYDVFVDRNWQSWILDITAWGYPTEPLLFEWEELQSAPWMTGSAARAQLRCVSADSAMRPAQSMYDALPVELRSTGAAEALADAAKRLTDSQATTCVDVIDDTDSAESSD